MWFIPAQHIRMLWSVLYAYMLTFLKFCVASEMA
jgi:hypothetical protein